MFLRTTIFQKRPKNPLTCSLEQMVFQIARRHQFHQLVPCGVCNLDNFGAECVILRYLLGISPVVLWHGTCALPSMDGRQSSNIMQPSFDRSSNFSYGFSINPDDFCRLMLAVLFGSTYVRNIVAPDSFSLSIAATSILDAILFLR